MCAGHRLLRRWPAFGPAALTPQRWGGGPHADMPATPPYTSHWPAGARCSPPRTRVCVRQTQAHRKPPNVVGGCHKQQTRHRVSTSIWVTRGVDVAATDPPPPTPAHLLLLPLHHGLQLGRGGSSLDLKQGRAAGAGAEEGRGEGGARDGEAGGPGAGGGAGEGGGASHSSTKRVPITAADLCIKLGTLCTVPHACTYMLLGVVCMPVVVHTSVAVVDGKRGKGTSRLAVVERAHQMQCARTGPWPCAPPHPQSPPPPTPPRPRPASQPLATCSRQG